MNIGIIGGGKWGTALAHAFTTAGNNTIIYRANLDLIVMSEPEKIDFTKVYDDPFNGQFSIKK